MNCRQAKEMINDLLDGDLAESGRRLLDRHLAQCDACDRHYEQLRAVDHLARDLAPVSPGSEFTNRVMGHLSESQPAVVLASGYGHLSLAGFLIGLIIALTVVPMIVTGQHWTYTYAGEAAGVARDWIGTAAADLVATGREALSAVAAAWTLGERFREALPAS